MDHAVEPAQFVCLVSYVLRRGDRGHFANDDSVRLRQRIAGVCHALGVARMQDNLVPLFHQQLSRHQSKPGRRTDDKNPCHARCYHRHRKGETLPEMPDAPFDAARPNGNPRPCPLP